MAPRVAGGRRGSAAKKKRSPFLRGVVLLMVGITFGVGGAAYFSAYVNKLPIPLITPPTQDANQSAQDSKNRAKRETLDFHDTLRKQQSLPQIEVTPADDAPAARRFEYYLQLASFSARESAEQLRGEVALLGWQAAIRPGRTAASGDIFRVWMGPYPTEDNAEEIRALLALQGYNNVQLLKLAANQ